MPSSIYKKFEVLTICLWTSGAILSVIFTIPAVQKAKTRSPVIELFMIALTIFETEVSSSTKTSCSLMLQMCTEIEQKLPGIFS